MPAKNGYFPSEKSTENGNLTIDEAQKQLKLEFDNIEAVNQAFKMLGPREFISQKVNYNSFQFTYV